MDSFLIKAVQLLLSLSILVILHEFGHYGFARLFRVRVDKFYVFFHPQISLLRWKRINGRLQFKFFARNVPANERARKDLSGNELKNEKGKPIMEQIPLAELPESDWRRSPESTEWGIGWVPVGGYCKIAGMVDESMDKTAMQGEPQKWEFRSQSVWKRFFIIAGGVLVNLLLAFAIYSAVLFVWGREYIPVENARYGYDFSQTMLENGFQNGDKILKINGQTLNSQKDIVAKLLLDGNRDVMVERDDSVFELRMPQDLAKKILASGTAQLLSLRYPFVIQQVGAGTPAAQAGLLAGDSVVGAGGEELFSFYKISAAFAASKSKEITIDFYRHSVKNQTVIIPSEKGKIGVSVKTALNFLQTKEESYGFFQSIPAGIAFGWETLVDYVKQFKMVFSKEGAQQLGGLGALGNMFPDVWDWQAFWMLTAFLSLALAFMNFLPIPGLDGGYALFLIYEAITGRKPSDKFMERATLVGFVLLIALMVFANGNDIFRFFVK